MTDRWRVSGNYTAQQVDMRQEPDSTNADTLATQESSPNHQFRITSGWDIGDDMEFDASVRYVDSIGPNGGPVDAYVTMDLRAAWRPKPNLELAIIGQNLLDNYHPEFRGFQPSPVTGEIPRGVFGKITASF